MGIAQASTDDAALLDKAFPAGGQGGMTRFQRHAYNVLRAFCADYGYPLTDADVRRYVLRERASFERHIAAAIADYTAQHGYPPTFVELRRALATDYNRLMYTLRQMRERGQVTWVDGRQRTIRVIRMPADSAGGGEAA